MNILHTLIGMGSAALAAAVPYPGKATHIFRKGQRSIYVKNNFKKQNKFLRLFATFCQLPLFLSVFYSNPQDQSDRTTQPTRATHSGRREIISICQDDFVMQD